METDYAIITSAHMHTIVTSPPLKVPSIVSTPSHPSSSNRPLIFIEQAVEFMKEPT